MNRAVFLDRDGTINVAGEGTGKSAFVVKPRQLKILPGAAQAIGKLNRLGFYVIVVTNQPVVARGLATPREIDRIHAVLIRRLKKQGARIDAVYFCPHHPNAHVGRYRLRCRCRKPNPGMLLAAMRKFGIDRKKSFMIGDSARDIAAGKRAGLRTILVKSGRAGGKDGRKQVLPDFAARNLFAAAALIARLKPQACRFPQKMSE